MKLSKRIGECLMQGRDFALCEGEQILARKALEICRRYIKTGKLNPKNELQKATEIFHLLAFLVTSPGIPKPKRILPHEPLDVIVKFKTCFNKDTFWRGSIGFEITTCFGAKKCSPGGHPIIDKTIKDLIKNGKTTATKLPKLPDTRPFRTQLISEIANKQGKTYEVTGITKKVLLIITGEPFDAWCPTTGNWHEKVIRYDELGVDGTKFDRICILNYFSSGKDGGPTTILDLTKEQKFYDSLFHQQS